MNILKIKKLLLASVLLVFPTSIIAGSGHYHYDGPDISGAKIKIFGPWLAPEDERFRDLSQRLINYLKPEFSSNEDKDTYHEFLKERLLTNGPWKITLEKAISRTNSLKIDAEESKDSEKLKIIDSLLDHYQEKKILSEL